MNITQSIPPSVKRSPPVHLLGEDIDALQLMKVVATRWPLILMVILLSVAIATAVAFLVRPALKAEVILLVSTDEDGNKLQGLSNIASQFGLAGGMTGDAATNKKAEAIATLQSEILTERYVQQNGLMPILFAAQWDSSREQWKPSDPQKQPTLWDANQLFQRIRVVAEDRRSGVVTMTISWKDGRLAAQWANGLVALTNSYLRQKAIDRSERNLAYLYGQLKETRTVEIQGAINKLIEGEINKTMLARGNEEYAFDVIDPAVVPPYRPLARIKLIILSGVVFGIIAGIAASLLAHWLRPRKVA